MKLRLTILALLFALLVLGLLWLRHKMSVVNNPPLLVLPRNDKELVVYNENRHTVDITTPTGIIRAYGRNPTVEIRKDGTVKVNSHSWGPEFRPFLGAGYSDTGRIYLGCQVLYVHQFDAGAAIGWTVDNRRLALQPLLSIGYNFWSNTSVNVGMDPVSFIGSKKPEIAVFLSVRL